MKVVSVAQMQSVEQKIIASGISERELMQIAGLSIFAELEKLLNLSKFKSILVICGKGNNGGDGYVLAECFEQAKLPVSVISAVLEVSLKKEVCYFATKIASKVNIKTGLQLPILGRETLVIDALFGTGFSGTLSSEYIKIIQQINASMATIVSVDIPSGLNGDSGVAESIAVRADYTITVGLPKIGLFQNNGLECVGLIRLAKLPVDEAFYNSLICDYEAFFEEESMILNRRRRRNTHKKSYGTVCVVGGSRSYHGAPQLSALGAMRAGCGYVSLATPSHLNISPLPLSLIRYNLSDGNLGFIGKTAIEQLNTIVGNNTVTIFGPGIGRYHDTTSVLKDLLKKANAMVIDADGLWHLTRIKGFGEFLIPTVLTPHPGE
ncbi:MAG: NAD(P)H-hydrate epimerase, partial [Lentisphaeria bacterium]